MIETFISILLIAIIVERCTEFLYSTKLLRKIDTIINQVSLKKLTAIMIGVTLAFTQNIDVISVILKNEDFSIIGYVLTGILFAGGANLISDIIKTFNLTKNKMLKKE